MALVLVPSGMAALVAWFTAQTDLAALVGTRVATVLSGTYPAVRVTLVDGSPETTGEFNAAHPTIQVECWDTTPEGADLLMRTLVAALPTIKGGTWAGAYVSGAFIDLGPVSSDDPASGKYRQSADVVLDVHHP